MSCRTIVLQDELEMFSLRNTTVICWSYLWSPLIALFRLAFSSNSTVENKTTKLSHRFVSSDFPPATTNNKFLFLRSPAPRGSKMYVILLPLETVF